MLFDRVGRKRVNIAWQIWLGIGLVLGFGTIFCTAATLDDSRVKLEVFPVLLTIGIMMVLGPLGVVVAIWSIARYRGRSKRRNHLSAS